MFDGTMAKSAVENLLAKLGALFALPPTGLQAPLLALHFGSTARGIIKPITDIDLFLVFAKVPKGRFERQALFTQFEEFVRKDFDALRNSGYLLDFSPIIVSTDALASFRGIFLDFPEDARVIYDPDIMAPSFLERIRSLRNRHGVRPEFVAGHRVWNCRGDLAAGAKFEPDF